jgi:type IV secretion system protein VirD4
MQLPPDDELVMVSGQPPIRAQKLRYHEDRNFTVRRDAPPALVDEGYPDCPPQRPDDWSALRPLVELAKPADLATMESTVGGDDGALARRPELEPAEIIAEREPNGDDLALLDDSDDFDVETVPSSVPNRRPDPRLQRVARLAALDPNDGIPL